MKIDWSSLNNAACYVIRGDGFLVNDYGHPDYIRYVEGNRLLTLGYEYVDETRQRGRRFFFFRKYVIELHIPRELCWDDGTPLTESEALAVVDRICRMLTQYKRRPCRAIVDDKLYEQIAAAQRTRQGGQPAHVKL
jgi:hypothetical protein